MGTRGDNPEREKVHEFENDKYGLWTMVEYDPRWIRNKDL